MKLLSKFLESDNCWEKSDSHGNDFLEFRRSHPPDLAILELDMNHDLFLLHLTQFGFTSEEEFNVYMRRL